MSSLTLTPRDINRAFKLRGLTLQSAACTAVQKVVLSSSSPTALNETLNTIIATTKRLIDSQAKKSPLVTLPIIEMVVADISTNEEVSASAYQSSIKMASWPLGDCIKIC